MASNGYNPYHHPYQQSSAIPYSAYQTAPAANSVAQSRQYQQTPTTQSQDYMSYPAQPYGGQSSGYGTGQDSSWNASNYGGARETTSRAAEVLHNMSNNAYTPNTTSATNQSNFAVANSTAQSNRHSNVPIHPPQAQTQSHATQLSCAQTQVRPNSVNANRVQSNTERGLPSPATSSAYASQRAQALYNQQQQRSASPAQHLYNSASTSAARSAAMTATVNQYNDYNARQLPSVDASRSSQNATSSTYGYANASLTASAANTSVPDIYSGSTATTVDPTAVYDPWPEYQRKQEVLRAQKAAEDAAREEEEEERQAEEQRKMEVQRRKEEEERLRPALSKQKKNNTLRHSNASEVEATPESSASPKDALESEIRAMMAKMRELNSKDPALLARIWEEERKAKAPRSPTTQTKPPPSEASQPVQPIQATTGPVANSRKKATPKDSLFTKTAKTAAAPPAHAVPPKAVAIASRPSGNTIWPQEKKAQLASAAVTFLKIQNPQHSVQPEQILAMLNRNPSYVELCGQLEELGLKLDRGGMAKRLLTAVPDINLAAQRAAPQPLPTANMQRLPAPPAVMKHEIATPAEASPQQAPAAGSPFAAASSAATPALVAQMVPIKPEFKPPANKEEAARKRKMSDLIDLTLLSEEEDFGPPPKRLNADSMYSMGAPHPHIHDAMVVDTVDEPAIKNFPIATHRPAQPPQPVQPPPEITRRDYVGWLDKKKALRRNTYNPATIARDVLLACGRHPSERSLNQHLDVLRTNLPQISFDSDLSTIRWDILDPGKPPPGYFKDVLQALTEDADDEDDSDDENRVSRPRAASSAIGGEGGVQARVQALPEATNPFKQKKQRGRKPHSLLNTLTPATPKHPPIPPTMSASVPRSASPAGGVGYHAFRTVTEHGPDGQPLPKKRGRPVGWRKAIHGSPAAQARPSANGHTGPFQHQPREPSSLRNVKTKQTEPIRIDSRSPSVADPRYQSYKCKWQNCPADLHNLDTLKKHVFRVHRKETAHHTLECHWNDCGKKVTDLGLTKNERLERHVPYFLDLESDWRAHIQQKHFDPLSWQLGDGPAGGLSDSHDSEAYLSDAQGRPLTPRIVVDPERLQALHKPKDTQKSGRGRGQKSSEGSDGAHEALARLVSKKKRIGGPGMDRGGATLVNDKRRRGLEDGHGLEEEVVDAED